MSPEPAGSFQRHTGCDAPRRRPSGRASPVQPLAWGFAGVDSFALVVALLGGASGVSTDEELASKKATPAPRARRTASDTAERTASRAPPLPRPRSAASSASRRAFASG